MTLAFGMGELSTLLAVMAIMLLVASQLFSSYSRRTTLLLNRKRLRSIAIVFSVLFLITVGIRLFEIIVLSSW
jgi:hypothetical protein